MAAEGRRTVLPLPDGVAAAWDLPPGTVAEPLGGGYHNTLLRIDDVVVKIEERSAESVAWEHELLAWLAPQLPEALQPFPSRDGATYRVVGHRIVSLLPYVEGTHDPSPDMPDVLSPGSTVAARRGPPRGRGRGGRDTPTSTGSGTTGGTGRRLPRSRPSSYAPSSGPAPGSRRRRRSS